MKKYFPYVVTILIISLVLLAVVVVFSERDMSDDSAAPAIPSVMIDDEVYFGQDLTNNFALSDSFEYVGEIKESQEQPSNHLSAWLLDIGTPIYQNPLFPGFAYAEVNGQLLRMVARPLTHQMLRYDGDIYVYDLNLRGSYGEVKISLYTEQFASIGTAYWAQEYYTIPIGNLETNSQMFNGAEVLACSGDTSTLYVEVGNAKYAFYNTALIPGSYSYEKYEIRK